MAKSADIYEREELIRRYDALLSHAFKLPRHSIDFQPLIKDHGICYKTGEIHIRLWRKDLKGMLSLGTVVDTLCHELAHLVEFNHKPAHRRLLTSMKVWLSRQQIS